MYILKNINLMILGAVIVLTFGVLTARSYAKLDPETLVGAWLFDSTDEKVAEDFSENENAGTLVGDPKEEKGKFGNALEFDGVDDYVNVGHNEILSPSYMTIMAWIKPNSLPTDFAFIAANGMTPSVGYNFRISRGKIMFYITKNSDAAGFSATGSTSVQAGVWYHVAGIFDGTRCYVYVDGKLDGTSSAIAADIIKPSTNDTVIGMYASKSTYPFDGIIDDVAIFNKKLSAEEINSIMNRGMELAYLAVDDLSDKLTTTWANIKTR